ncbi:acyl-CoA thioesterase [Polluticoccus soli]|uniref:acyl-CoA thioesterase n=1 Tax=Polluticoccus soli TaxID=3034150 RepID=UPI0023E133A6|nr:acyl-CoA thioesterase [Flavipsychrobacter sp. JY13-12]
MKKTKSTTESEVVMTEVVYPNDANPMGMLQGGRLVQWMDTASAVCAQTHAGRIAVTALLDKVVFKSPARVGDIITINAKLVAAFSTSMEVCVQAWARKVISGDKHPVCEAYFTFVALDGNAKPASVPKLKLKTAEEQVLFEQAESRKLQRSKG